MSTKTTNTSTNQYNQSSMGTYNAFQPQLMGSLMQMVNNPLGSSYFQNQLAQQQAASRQIGQRSNANALQNLRTGGGILSNAGGFAAGMLNRNQNANNGMQANAFNTALNSALQNRNFALASMQAYQPLQTGQTSTQQQSGLGTWLPQLLGAGLGMAMPGIGGMMAGTGFMSGYRNSSGGYSGPSNPLSGTMSPMMSGIGMPAAPAPLNPYNMPGLGGPGF